jgi:outer membrane protein assembly factor BamB
MNITARICIGVLATALAAPCLAQETVRFEDLSGWWSADPVHGGETSRLSLQFVDDKQEAHLSLPAIGAYDINLGAVTISGSSINTQGLAFPLNWNPTTRTLAGTIPAEAAPIYDIPVEFRRGEPLVPPPANRWETSRPTVTWSVDTGAPIWAGIERDSDGTLYVGNETGMAHAIDRKGKVRWQFATGGAIRAQPRVVGAYIYIASDSGFLHKLNRKSGTEAWRTRVVVDAPPRLPTNEKGTRWDRYGASVVTDGRQVFYASRDRNLYALDEKTGRELWRVTATDMMTATPALYGDLVIFAAYDGKVNAVDRSSGKSRWTFDARLAVPGDLTVSGDRLLLGSRSYDLIALDAASGRELWRRYYWFSWIESPPAVRDGVVYTGSSDATQVYAVNLADGTVRWKTAVPGYSWQRTALSEEFVVAGTVGSGEFPGPRAGSLVAMDRATGGIRWVLLDPPGGEAAKSAKAWGFGASPVIAGNVVYAADLAGKVHAIVLDTKK